MWYNIFKVRKEGFTSMEEVKQKVLERLSKYWENDTEEIKSALNNGKDGAEELLDWCRDEYDQQEQDVENDELDGIWDICNWYLDFLNGDKTQEDLLSLINIY